MDRVENIIRSHKRICWYPSAGGDFRELLFLSEAYLKWMNVSEEHIDKSKLPDLFILTDCKPTNFAFGYHSGKINIEFLNHKWYQNKRELFVAGNYRTRIEPLKIELVGKVNLPFDSNLFRFDISPNYGNAYYMSVRVFSNQLGSWDAKILYILTENTTFAFDYLLKKNISIDYIIKVRYGDHFGESTIIGDWLLRTIKPLHVKYYLANPINPTWCYRVPDILKEKYPEYAELFNEDFLIDLTEIHCVPEYRWSWQGDVCWYKVM